MPRRRTKFQAKREAELSAGEILDVCGPSWSVMKHEANPAPPRRARKRARRVLTTWEKIGQRIKLIRAERRLDQIESKDEAA